eukprot:2067008-Pleurochrysis_carterae.AAC.1
MASWRPKVHSVEDDSQSWLTERSESEKIGTHRTLRSVRSIEFPFASSARISMSPMTVQNCALPSIPATLSEHGLVLNKSV